jgi:mRNA interferase HigB
VIGVEIYLNMRYIYVVHIITRKRLLEFQKNNRNASTPLDAWYRIVKNTEIANFFELREIFSTVYKVGNLTVFNIGGNKIWLIAAVHYNTQCIFIRHVLTHKEYDKHKWKN